MLKSCRLEQEGEDYVISQPRVVVYDVLELQHKDTMRL